MSVCLGCERRTKDGFEYCYECNQARKEPEPFDHDGVITETDKAVCFKIGEGLTAETIWIPKSQMPDYDNKQMWIPMWLAEEKNLA